MSIDYLKNIPIMEQRISYKCIKCGSTRYESDEIRTTGGGLSRFFDVQNKKFVVVSCESCGYSELYKRKTGALGNIFDFFTS